MAKYCANGHQMEDSWEICPYCAKTGFIPRAQDQAPTRVEAGLTAAQKAMAVPLPSESVQGGTRFIGTLGATKKPSVVGCLLGLSGQDKGQGFWLREGINKIGRNGQCQVVLKGDSISDIHAIIRHHDGKFYLRDTDSTNGTFVNEQTEPLMETYELQDHDTLRLGDVMLKFRCL